MADSNDALQIRIASPADLPGIERIYPAAFPDEDLLPLVRRLLAEVPAPLSLIAVAGSTDAIPEVVGHVVFTRGSVARAAQSGAAQDGAADTGVTCAVALLGPLAVAPTRQRQGIGSALVREGLQRLTADGIARVFVLGSPDYYGQLGFRHETKVMPPYDLPPHWLSAWQSVDLDPSGARCHGVLRLPAPWLQPSLWAP